MFLEDYKMTFAEKVMSTRLALNLSQKELADKVGVSERSIYSYEQTNIFPRKTVLKKLADALNVSVTYLSDEKVNNRMKNLGEEMFIANVKDEYGYRSAQEAEDVLERASALFAGGDLDDDAKDIFFQSLMEVYMESKAEASIKFAPKRRVSRR
jgi:transcriptional regulator with XRE-family HTH domain